MISVKHLVNRVFTFGVLALLLATLASFQLPQVAQAANGDNLASFDAAVTAGIPGCASGVGTGLAYDTTTDSLVLSCWDSNVLQRVDAVTHLNDGSVAIAGLPFGDSIEAMAYDAGRNRIWACNGHGHVVLIDVTTGTVDGSIPAFAVAACTDGLAYDGSDDTIYASPDVSATVYHYDLAGGLLGSFVPAIGACGNSGIAVGGPKLYLANNGCSEIYEANKDGSGSVLFASFPARLEDLECDNETFAGAGKGAIWSQDAYDRILNAWEIPADQCVSGGGEPKEEICGDGIDNDGDGLVDEDCPDITPPTASCEPTTNPSGKNEPTAPGKGEQGQNQDGFYQLFGTDDVAVDSIVVRDSGSPFVSAPFANGDKVKVTQAPGATPGEKRPGPGVIVSHLTLKGDAILKVTDTSGNVTEVFCLVPPKPQ